MGVQRYTNPYTNTSADCARFCAPDDGPCYCERLVGGASVPWRHTHATHDPARGGATFYDGFVRTPELAGARVVRPPYCPPASSAKAQYNATFDDGLEKVCLKCWYKPGSGAPC